VLVLSQNCLFQLQNFLLIPFDDIAHRLFNINLFFKNFIQESRFYIHLINLPFILRRKRNYHPYSFQTCDRNKNFTIINVGSLTLSLDNRPYFVSFDFSFSILLCLEHPLHSNGFLLFQNSRQLPCIFLFNCFNFLIHDISPFFIFHNFLKTYWFTIRKNVNRELDHHLNSLLPYRILEDFSCVVVFH
jgi:hypothetical protein